MKRMTLLSLLTIFILTISSYGDSFIIKLASYTNKESLIEKIKLLDNSIKKNIILIEENKLYKLFSESIQNKEKALKLLPIYQKIFSDAYIMVNTYTDTQKEDINITMSLQEESNTSLNKGFVIIPTHTLMHPNTEKKPRLSFQEIIENKTFYLCPQSIHSQSEKILIEAVFSTDSVNYNTIMGKVPSMQMKYTIQKNRLYLITNNKISISQFHTIDKILFEYMIISRWFKGKKIHQMRYYKNKADAQSYIASISLN
jgi:hypothetical protein